MNRRFLDTGVIHHEWIRSKKPISTEPETYRWKCLACGTSFKKSNKYRDEPTKQDLAEINVDYDCALQAARKVMES